MTEIKYKTNQNDPAIKAYVTAVKKGKNSQHIFFINDKWVVKKPYQTISKTFDSQVEAKKYAISLARRDKASVFVYSKEGEIQERQDF
jgi:hypothetical protein